MTDEELDRRDHEVGWCSCEAQGMGHAFHPDDGYSYASCGGPICEAIRNPESDTLTAGERKRGRRKVLDNRRSVFLMQRLSTEPRRRQAVRRKRGA